MTAAPQGAVSCDAGIGFEAQKRTARVVEHPSRSNRNVHNPTKEPHIMASSILSQPTADDIVTSGGEAYGIASLMVWINSARAFIHKVQVCAANDPQLAARLKEHDVRLSSADWETETGEGMEVLLLRQQNTIREMCHVAQALAG
jgi:hypothetical protein